MTYKLLVRNKTYPGYWEVCVIDSDNIEDMTYDKCSWCWKYLVYDNDVNPKMLKIVKNDFDFSILNPPIEIVDGIDPE